MTASSVGDESLSLVYFLIFPFRSTSWEEIADMASLSKEERRLYDADIRAYRDRLTELGTAKRDGEKIGERRNEKTNNF